MSLTAALQLAAVALLVAVWSCKAAPCTPARQTLSVSSTTEATALALAVDCANGLFVVDWIGQVATIETIYLHEGTVLNITGSGSTSSVIDGGKDSSTLSMFEIGGAELHLLGVGLINANGTYGGVINAYQDSLITVTDCAFANNTATYGGGINGGINSSLTLMGNVSFQGNRAISIGGAIYFSLSSVMTVNGNVHFEDNGCEGNGGAIYIGSESKLHLGGTTSFLRNWAVYGGAIALHLRSYLINTGTAKFEANHVWTSWPSHSFGGAIYNEDSELILKGRSLFLDNYASSYGGAIHATPWIYHGTNTSTVVSGHALFDGNAAGLRGGAFAATNSVVMINGSDDNSVNLTANRAYGGEELGGGGAVSIEMTTNEYASSLSVLIAGVNFVANAAIPLGYDNESAVLLGQDNDTATSNGGGLSIISVSTEEEILNLKLVVVEESLFLRNEAAGEGGALYLFGGVMTALHTRFMDNRAGISGGAALVAGVFRTDYCEFFGNKAPLGPALSNSLTTIMFTIDFSDNTLLCPDDNFLNTSVSVNNQTNYDRSCFECPPWRETFDGCWRCTMNPVLSPGECSPVLSHTTSPDADGTLETLSLDAGYWRSSETSVEILPCYNSDACTGGVAVYCAEGYTGPFCAVCDDGYTSGWDYSCNECSDDAAGVALAIATCASIILLLVVVFAWRYLASASTEQESVKRAGWRSAISGIWRSFPLQAFKIVIVAWQIVTQFASAASVTYPEMYERFLRAVDVFNLDLVWVVSPGCFVDVTFYDRLLAVTLGPLVVLVVLLANYAVARRRYARGESSSPMRRLRDKHVSAFLLVTFLVYSTVSTVVFQTFACDELDDGTAYLRADHRQECTTATHRLFEVYAGLMIVVYPVGIPLLYAALLYTNRSHLTHSKRGENDRVRPFQDLWQPYRKKRYYYEIVEYVRRVALTGVVVFLFPNSSAQVAVTFLLALLFFAVSEVLNPYETRQDSWLSRLGHAVVLLSMYFALLLKVDVAEDGNSSQELFSAVLVTTNVAMIVVVVVECLAVCWSVVQSRAAELPRRRVGVEKTASIMEEEVEEEAEVAEEEKEGSLPSYEENTAAKYG